LDVLNLVRHVAVNTEGSAGSENCGGSLASFSPRRAPCNAIPSCTTCSLGGTTIIQNAGMSVRKPVVHGPRTFAAKAGAVSGSVKLVAPSAARRASYEWEYSVNGGHWCGQRTGLLVGRRGGHGLLRPVLPARSARNMARRRYGADATGAGAST
jgi:hypothetical protein